MTRNASDCLLCHLTGLFADRRQKEYDEWLLQEIEQAKGLAFPAVHFSLLHTGLNFSDSWKEKKNWQALIDLRAQFDILQINISDIADTTFAEFLQWNQNLENPFHIYAVLLIPNVKENVNTSIEQAYLRLREIIEIVFSVCKMPIDGISFENTDYLWKESLDSQKIEARNHYLLRHVRSAMDRIGARQSLFVHSKGNFSDVNNYFSDGNNEIQLAGSTELTAMLVKSLQEGNSEAIAGVTSQFSLNSLETAYFHTYSNTDALSAEQSHLVRTIVCTCSGIPIVDFVPPEIKNLEAILNLRKNHTALHVQGAQIQLGTYEQIWAIQRYSMDMGQSLLCLANLSGESQKIIFGEEYLSAGEVWKDVFTGEEYTAGDKWGLKPYQVLLLV